jgi:hypothetical protein
MRVLVANAASTPPRQVSEPTTLLEDKLIPRNDRNTSVRRCMAILTSY